MEFPISQKLRFLQLPIDIEPSAPLCQQSKLAATDPNLPWPGPGDLCRGIRSSRIPRLLIGESFRAPELDFKIQGSMHGWATQTHPPESHCQYFPLYAAGPIENFSPFTK